jgi:hypothetical protein
MALRLGIGDAVTICKSVLDACKSGHLDSGKEVQTIVAEMEQMRGHLKSLEIRIGDEKTFAAAKPDV